MGAVTGTRQGLTGSPDPGSSLTARLGRALPPPPYRSTGGSPQAVVASNQVCTSPTLFLSSPSCTLQLAIISPLEMKETKPTPLHHEHAPLPARGARGARFAADPGNARDSTGMDGRPLGPATTVDTEKGTSSAYASSDTGLQLREDRVKAERKLLWKFGEFHVGFAGGCAGARTRAPCRVPRAEWIGERS